MDSPAWRCPLRNYIIQRLALTVPTILGLTVLVFFLLHVVIKTDAVDIMLAEYGSADPELAQQLREEFGLGGSMVTQYLRWLGNILTGDLGTSLFTKRSVASELATRMPTSIEIGVGALMLSTIIAIPIGIISAVKQDSLPDYVLRGSAILLDAIPGFWAATLVLVFGSVWFGWAPPLEYRSLWEDPVANLKIMITPMILLGLQPVGRMVRLVRTQVLEIVRQDYVRTATAKGLGWRPLYTRHVLRNALLPVVTVIGLQLPRLIAGTVIFETVFGLPGVGRYLLDAVGRLDYPVILATNLVFGLTLILANLIVDVSYGWIDPRIRFS
ncbi:MAG: ABC transporter permease [Dehalococcoidia bacterium]